MGGSAAVEELRKPAQMRALSGTVYSFQGNEFAAQLDFQRELTDGLWYFATALLCSASEFEKCELPSPRATKYNAVLGAGSRAALIDARPGSAIGVGGKPDRKSTRLNSSHVSESRM